MEVDSTIVSDDDDDGSEPHGTPSNEDVGQNEWPQCPESDTPCLFQLDGPKTMDASTLSPMIIVDEEERQDETAVAELLRHHHNMGHLSFTKVQEMAKQGIFPSRIAKCAVPICSACQYAKATRRQWRIKSHKHNQDAIESPTKPGQCVLVDQLVSPTPGLIAQMTGFITKQWYRYATVYVDQYSGISFIYLQCTASAAETLEGKRAFEWYAQLHDVTISAYHADNGIFKACEWVENCHQSQQGLTFAGVGAHHANGKAERCIRELQELACTQLIHANRRWPQAISAHLWPYALRHANDCINAAPNMQHSKCLSPTQLFAKTMVNINKKHWKPFSCPV